MSLSFRFVDASRKNYFHVSLLKHSIVLQVAKYFAHLPVLSLYIKLNLVDALFARTQTSFGTGQTVHVSFINRNGSMKQILLTWFMIFPFSCLQTQEFSRSI